MLAGISVDYYTRFERGNARGVSEELLGAVAGALQLSADERTHLENLVRAANEEGQAREHVVSDEVRPAIRRIIDCMTAMPALLRIRRLDILYANALGRALYVEAFEDPDHPPSPLRYAFLDPRSRVFFVDWTAAADEMVGLLRAETGRRPGDPTLAELVHELSGRSEPFARRWAQHDVRLHREGVADHSHPRVGPLTLAYEDLDLPRQPEQTILVLTAEAGSPSEQVLRQLAEIPAVAKDPSWIDPSGIEP